VLDLNAGGIRVTSHQTRALLGFAVGGACLWLAIRHASSADLARVLGSAKPGWLALAVLAYWLELGARVIRWRALLSHMEKDVRLGDAASAFMIGYAANNVLPAKLGELVRVDLISRLAGVSRMASLGTVMVERLFDVLLIVLMAGISIGALVLPATVDVARLRSGMLLLGTGSALLLVIAMFVARNGVSGWNVSGWKLSPAIRARLGNLVRGIHTLASPARCGRILAASLVIWALNAVAMWLIVFALGVTLSPLQTLLLVGIVGLVAVLPAPPGGLGVLQYAFTLVFELLGKPSAVGLVASATVQIALLGSVTLVGALLFIAIVVPPPAGTRATDG
jgi:uncharacterized protein (TIRG00374 family)